MLLIQKKLRKDILIQGRRLILLTLAVSVMVLVLIYTTQDLTTLLYRSYKIADPLDGSNEQLDLNMKVVDDFLLSYSKPPPGRTIFFHETSCNHPDSGLQMMNLTARQACAIESAALHNPNFQVLTLFSCPTHRPLSGRQKTLIEAIESYQNVQLRHLNLRTYATGTPIEEWVKKGDLFQSNFPMQHTADLLRLISLYRFGGIYLDMDVVVLRSLENFPLNCVGAHDNITLGNAVISLEPDGKGHEIGELFLQDYQKNFDGRVYVQVGPALVTRVVKAMCGSDLVKVMREGPNNCHGLTVFNFTAFFPLPWTQWNHFFLPEYLEKTMARTKDSYLIHLWNKASYRGVIKVGSNTAYGKYAEIHCPKTYAAAGEYF